jgi:hypothetical protein
MNLRPINENNLARRLCAALATAPTNDGKEIFHVVNRVLSDPEHARAAFMIRSAVMRRYKDSIKIDDVIEILLRVFADEKNSRE